MDLKKLPIRLILAVFAGIVIAFVLSTLTHLILHWVGIFPSLKEPMFDSKLLIVSLCYHSFYAIVGAYFTAQIAKKEAIKAAFLLGLKEAIMWFVGTLLLWKHAAPWFNISKAVLGIPLALLGGKMFSMYKNHRDNKRTSFPIQKR